MREAEPVPQPPEPFAAGPGDRLLQLPLLDAPGGARAGARRGNCIRRGQAVWVLMIWGRLILGHCGLLVRPGRRRMPPGQGARVAGSSVGSGRGDHHAEPPTRSPTESPTRICTPPRLGHGAVSSGRVTVRCEATTWAAMARRCSAADSRLRFAGGVLVPYLPRR